MCSSVQFCYSPCMVCVKLCKGTPTTVIGERNDSKCRELKHKYARGIVMVAEEGLSHLHRKKTQDSSQCKDLSGYPYYETVTEVYGILF